MTEENKGGIAGVKKITFDFEFTYPKEGDEELGDTIVVREPSYEDLEVHSRMTSLVTKGIFKVSQITKNSGSIDEGASDVPSSNSSSKSDEEQNAMFLMALGMDDKKYIEFVRYVKKLLTNDNRFAHIDGEELGVSDELWKTIEKEGGKKAVDKVLSTFVNFFIEAMSQTETKAA